jgi:hypothetical protein
LKIIIIILIGYNTPLNNFNTHIKNIIVDDGNFVISKLKNELIFLKKKIIGSVNLETDPRLGYLALDETSFNSESESYS